MNNAFKSLWQSTQRLHQRFEVYPPQTTETLRVMNEEHLEVIEAALTSNVTDLVEEGADLIVTLMGVLMSRNVALPDLEAAMLRVAAKNDAKTHDTHEINTSGKIARKKPK